MTSLPFHIPNSGPLHLQDAWGDEFRDLATQRARALGVDAALSRGEQTAELFTYVLAWHRLRVEQLDNDEESGSMFCGGLNFAWTSFFCKDTRHDRQVTIVSKNVGLESVMLYARCAAQAAACAFDRDNDDTRIRVRLLALAASCTNVIACEMLGGHKPRFAAAQSCNNNLQLFQETPELQAACWDVVGRYFVAHLYLCMAQASIADANGVAAVVQTERAATNAHDAATGVTRYSLQALVGSAFVEALEELEHCVAAARACLGIGGGDPSPADPAWAAIAKMRLECPPPQHISKEDVGRYSGQKRTFEAFLVRAIRALRNEPDPDTANDDCPELSLPRIPRLDPPPEPPVASPPVAGTSQDHHHHHHRRPPPPASRPPVFLPHLATAGRGANQPRPANPVQISGFIFQPPQQQQRLQQQQPPPPAAALLALQPGRARMPVGVSHGRAVAPTPGHGVAGPANAPVHHGIALPPAHVSRPGSGLYVPPSFGRGNLY